MTKKKMRSRLARALRAEGFKGGTAFRLAKAIIRAGSPYEMEPEEMAPFGLEAVWLEHCECCVPTCEVIGPLGESVTAAWVSGWW